MQNLGTGVPKDSSAYVPIMTTRQQIGLDYLVASTSPKMPAMRNMLKSQISQRGEALETKLRLLQQLQADLKLRKQMAQMIEKQQEQNKILEPILRRLMQEDKDELQKSLTSEDPLVRWLAAMVVGRKQVHLEENLIGLLTDDQPQVREAARQSLVRLGRSTDFGPMPTATPQQRVQSAQAWRTWLSLQKESPTEIK
jgi:hypothetical protein